MASRLSCITPERAKEVYIYAPETGIFTRKIRQRSWMPGTIAGCVRPDGYRVIMLDGKSMRAHWLAWFFTHGEWPSKEIDHIDGNPDNNSIRNLRHVNSAQNKQNQRRPRKDNHSGLLGVSWKERQRKWVAQISLNGVNRYLGLFEKKEDAYCAYVAAKRSIHSHGML